MFQFPGFALKPLCIQGKSTWLTPLFAALADRNNRVSGGFPHSDISGSKPVPGSPKLNAGYHVLHRLLLPRHPPNALFVLDLIQKEQGWFNLFFPVFRLATEPVVCKSKPHVKSCILSHRRITFRVRLVSVLDLEQYRPNRSDKCMQPPSDPMHPILGRIKRY